MASKTMRVLNIVSGVLLILIGIYCLCNQDIAAATAGLMGSSRFVSAFDLKALGVRNWGWALAIGIILMIAGFICMMDPWVGITAVGMTVGLVFLLEGVSSIIYACIPRTK